MYCFTRMAEKIVKHFIMFLFRYPINKKIQSNKCLKQNFHVLYTFIRSPVIINTKLGICVKSEIKCFAFYFVLFIVLLL